jgi:hypothetical protein
MEPIENKVKRAIKTVNRMVRLVDPSLKPMLSHIQYDPKLEPLYLGGYRKQYILERRIK